MNTSAPKSDSNFVDHCANVIKAEVVVCATPEPIQKVEWRLMWRLYRRQHVRIDLPRTAIAYRIRAIRRLCRDPVAQSVTGDSGRRIADSLSSSAMEIDELAGIVRELADKEAIRDLTFRYVHQVWRQDAVAVVELFAEDGEMDTSLEEPIRGRAALLEAFERLIDGADLQPFVHNHIIELDGEDVASGVCYVDLRSVQNGKSMMGSGYYTDRYVRVDGQWKFKSRALTLRHFVPLEDGWASS